MKNSNQFTLAGWRSAINSTKTTMQILIDNLINGNNTTAKKLARHFKSWEIRDALVEMGWSENKSTLAADWLKGRDCWQAYCDAN